jgi:hypothetical protein
VAVCPHKPLPIRGMVGKKFRAKNWSNGVDCPPSSVILLVPLKAGLLYFGVCSTYIWDCKLAQFCPGKQKRKPAMVGRLCFLSARD